jgi:LysR family transcriptional regulator, transcriptional activator of the cysJI operon
MLKKIDLNKLKVFYYIYTLSSITEAARELNVTPSAISQNLKNLEGEIQARLFTRIHKKLIPTAEAGELIQILEPFFFTLDERLKRFLHGKNTPYGMVRLGAPVEFGKTYLPPIISSFRKEYPDVLFSLILGNQQTHLNMLSSGELDFAITDLFLNQKSYLTSLDQYHVEAIMDEEIILACSKEYYRNCIKDDLSFENLVQQDYISYDHNHQAIAGWFSHHFAKQSVKIKAVLTVDSIQAVLAAIENDVGLGVITSNQMHSEKITVISSKQKEIINTISLIQLKDKVPTFTEKTFQKYLKGVLSKQI